MIITSYQNPTIKKIATLKDKKGRQQQNAYLVEGVKMVKEAINKGMPIKLVVGVKDLVENLPFNGEKIIVEESVLKKLSDCETCQGLFAVIQIPQDNFEISTQNCVLLDRVRDPGNLGTIIRTSVACGVKNIYLRDCVDCYSPKVVRASMSGIYSVNLINIDDVKLQELSKKINFLVADMCGENVFKYSPNSPFCLVMGNEANGVSQEVKDLAYKSISIPMKGDIESLNVGIAYAVIMYHLNNLF